MFRISYLKMRVQVVGWACALFGVDGRRAEAEGLRLEVHRAALEGVERRGEDSAGLEAGSFRRDFAARKAGKSRAAAKEISAARFLSKQNVFLNQAFATRIPFLLHKTVVIIARLRSTNCKRLLNDR